MSDFKQAYSDISADYIENVVPASEIDQNRYDRSKAREELYNEDWLENKVNLNEIVDKFIDTTEVVGERTESGYKYIFEGSRYQVKCDKVAGYCRIYDKELQSYCKLDGTPSKNGAETHFKIMRREEM